MITTQTIKAFTVIASVAKQSSASLAALDCRVADAPRNDVTGERA